MYKEVPSIARSSLLCADGNSSSLPSSNRFFKTDDGVVLPFGDLDLLDLSREKNVTINILFRRYYYYYYYYYYYCYYGTGDALGLDSVER